jgi:hypothetical protein
VIIGALMLLAQIQAPPRDAKASTARTGTISGIVITDEAQPRPLRHARVTLKGDALDADEAVMTGDDGAFTFEDVPAGAYELTAAKGGYVTAAYGAARPGGPGRAFDLAAGEARRIELRVARGGVITGTVLDAAGQPVEGAGVVALLRRMGASGPEYHEAGSPALPTDDRGVYRIFGLPPDNYLIAVQPSGRRLGFEPGERIRAMSAGRPSERTYGLAHVFYPSVTDITRAGRVGIAAGEERDGIDVQLQYVPLATISGSARPGPDWTPAQVALVRLDEVDGGERALTALADANGSFSFRGIPPGRYRILARVARITPPGQMPDFVMDRVAGGGMRFSQAVRLSGALDLDIAGEDVTDLTIPLQPALTMTGRIQYDGERPPAPLTEMQIGVPAVSALAAAGQRFPPLVVTGTTFRADMIEPGTYRFGARPVVRGRSGEWWLKSLVAGGVELLDSPIEIRQNVEDVVATITSRASTLSGIVADSGGHPRAGITVIAFSADRGRWFVHSRRIVAVETGGDGHFAIRNLPAGDYRVVATADLVDGEWFDSDVLERLLPQSTAVSVADAGTSGVALTIR